MIGTLYACSRATARLGRDVSANGLFARLGTAALQAEDLYLLGIGLNRGPEGTGRVSGKRDFHSSRITPR